MNSMQLPKYIFWDFDNTLGNTDKHALPSLIQRFNAIYFKGTISGAESLITDHPPLTYELFKEKFHGLKTETLCEKLSAYYNVNISVMPLYEDRERKMIEYYSGIPGGVEIAPYVVDVIKAFREAGAESCVVTNNPLERAFGALRSNPQGKELASLFEDRWFTVGAKSKPDPDVYVFTMNNLSACLNRAVLPKECFAVEDSVTGVASSVGAGIPCYGYTGFIDSSDKERQARTLREKGAIAAVDDLRHLAKIYGLPLLPSNGKAFSDSSRDPYVPR
jgi:beta-phosphoglucomutase-like phosphatase (HAD superfamily)